MKIKTPLHITFSLLFIFLNSCEILEKESDIFFVEVSTADISEITANTAISGGNVLTKSNNNTITEKGVLWNTEMNEIGIDFDGRVYNNTRKSEHGSGPGSFSSTLDFLSPNTQYYVRAYAINDYSVFYGDQISFTTSDKPIVFGNGVTDIDGNNYITVIINNQEWMAENLKSTHLNDGIPIKLETNNTLWSNLTTPAYCWYDNDKVKNGSIHGSMYNWHVVNTGKLCPTGWHVPSYWEWKSLIDYLGGVELAGGKLKKEYPGYGVKPTNEVGFSALLGGRRQDGRFYNLSSLGFWWSRTTLSNLTDAYSIYMDDYGSFAKFTSNKKADGLAVRCIRD